MSATVPASAIEDQQDPLFGPRTDLLGKDREGLIKPVAIHPGQNQPCRLPRGRMDKSIEISPLITGGDFSNRALPHLGPNLANDRFESDAMLVKRPDFNGGIRIALFQFRFARGQFF